MQANKIDFKGQDIFVGIDVHKKNWSIAIVVHGYLTEKFSIDSKPKILKRRLNVLYPNGNYHSVYEAGFSGYWADRELRRLGIDNIIVNPADVPTRSKERRRKTDRVDAIKLAKQLSVGNLEPIYVPSREEESLRSLVRLREQLKKDRTREKNRIKSLLNFVGITVPVEDEKEEGHWSKGYIETLKNLDIEYPELKQTLDEDIIKLENTRSQMARVIKSLRETVKANAEIREIIDLLLTTPGVGFITAITFYSEIIDINRFRRLNELAAYVGLAPAVVSSGEKEKTLGLSKQRNKYLRNLLIEASWKAIKKDRCLQNSYGKLLNRMTKQKAIIRIARKLLNRIARVWRERQPYQTEVC